MTAIRKPTESEILPSSYALDDGFGSSVSISGTYAIVGAPYDGTYIFQRSGNSWNQVAKLTASDSYVDLSFGLSVSISGGYVLVGAPGVAATVGQI
jgi:hypothetical protein